MNFRLTDLKDAGQLVGVVVLNAVRRKWDGRPLQISITFADSERTIEQNNKMWAMLRDIARQVPWYGQTRTPEDWKHLITAHLTGQEVVPGIGGGFVQLGQSTRKMSIKQMGDVIECAYWFGTEHDVIWTDPLEQALIDQYEAEARSA